MKERIIQLAKAKILVARLEGQGTQYIDKIMEDPEKYILRGDHGWRYNPNLPQWIVRREGAEIVGIIREFGQESEVEEFYNYCRELYDGN